VMGEPSPGADARAGRRRAAFEFHRRMADVAPRRFSGLCFPGLESPGYRHGIAPRCPNGVPRWPDRLYHLLESFWLPRQRGV